MKKIPVFSALLLLVLFFAAAAHAEGVMVRPFLIDETVTPRDIITKTITVTNEGANRSAFYATVNEISVGTEGEIKEFISPVMTDRTDTVTSWIEISRARIMLDPGESAEVPLTLQIHPFASPGVYHAFIGFSAQTNRPKADAAALAGEADGVILKVTVADETVEALRISTFKIKRFIINEKQGAINIEIENIGDAGSAPAGEIIFYSARGEEIGFVTINDEGENISPGDTLVVTTTVPFSDNLGRLKANLTLRYGENGKSSVFDTVQFYMIPYKVIVLLLFVIIFFTILVTVLIKRLFDEDVYDDDEHGTHIPLFVKTGREYKEMDHDITLTKDS